MRTFTTDVHGVITTAGDVRRDTLTFDPQVGSGAVLLSLEELEQASAFYTFDPYV